MDKNDWQLVEELFHKALARPAEERTEFIESQCLSAEVAREVHSLLASHETQDDWLNDVSSDSRESLLGLTVEMLRADSRHATIIDRPLPERSSRDGQSDLVEPRLPAEEPVLAEELAYWQQLVGERYELLTVLGRGGIGTVFSAVDKNLHRAVAIKVINDRSFDEKARNRLRRESRAAAQTSSDYLVTIHAIEEHNGIPFLVMEYIAGKTLAQWIAERQTLEPHQAADLVRQVALGLADAHHAGLIHRDIKPSNILLAPLRGQPTRFRAKLTDFGLARTHDPGDSLAASCVGTPAYMSPELIVEPEQVDQLTDVYALGATLYQCLTGVAPFSGTTISILRSIQFDEPLPVRRLNESVPVDLESICQKALSKSRRDRYAAAGLMADDLARFMAGEPTLARPVTRVQRIHKWILRNRKEAALIAVSASLALLLTVGSVVTAGVLYAQNQQILEGRRQSLSARVDQLLHCSPVSLPIALQLLEDDHTSFPHEQFEAVIAASDRSQQEQINAAIACSLAGYSQTDFLLDHIGSCRPSPPQALMLYRALAVDAERAMKGIEARYAEAATNNSRFRFAYLAAALGNPQPINQLCDGHPDPNGRTEVIHQLASFYGDARLLELLLADVQLSSDARSALLCGLALIDVADWERDRQLSVAQLASRLSHDTHAGLAAAATTLLNRWTPDAGITMASPPETQADLPPNTNSSNAPLAYADYDAGVRMVRVPLGPVRMGRADNELYGGYPSHQVTLTRPYEIMDREVSVQLFQTYLEESQRQTQSDSSQFVNAQNEQFNAPEQHQADQAISPGDAYPMQRVTWYDAVTFCNWLSRRHGLAECYTIEVIPSESAPGSESNTGEGSMTRLPVVELDDTADGFRLPTEAEWEYACRAGAETDYFFGDDPDLLEYYGRVSNARVVSALPCGSLLPNRWGLFDMHGNVWEWCQDWQHVVDGSPLVDPRGPASPATDGMAKIYRGSGVATLSGEPTAAARGSASPTVRYQNLGFRLARTLP